MINKQLAREVFERISAEADAVDCHWNQGHWAFQRQEDADTEELTIIDDQSPREVTVAVPNCGTSLCFAGWTAIIADPNARLIMDDRFYADEVLLGDGTTRFISSYAMEAMGLEAQEERNAFAALFDGDNDLSQIEHILTYFGVFED